MQIQFHVKNPSKKKCKSSFLPNEVPSLRVQTCLMQYFKTSSLVDSRWNCIFEQPWPHSARTVAYLFLHLSLCSQLTYTVVNFFTVPVIFLKFCIFALDFAIFDYSFQILSIFQGLLFIDATHNFQSNYITICHQAMFPKNGFVCM